MHTTQFKQNYTMTRTTSLLCAISCILLASCSKDSGSILFGNFSYNHTELYFAGEQVNQSFDPANAKKTLVFDGEGNVAIDGKWVQFIEREGWVFPESYQVGIMRHSTKELLISYYLGQRRVLPFSCGIGKAHAEYEGKTIYTYEFLGKLYYYYEEDGKCYHCNQGSGIYFDDLCHIYSK